jgi:DNA modification methylase
MNKVIQGNNIDILKTYPDNTFDSIVTDPPYGIEFLSKEWDSNTGAVETWAECFRVLKPGGYILAFSAARTYHNLATNIEGVGFEIRDQIMWLYASGFPKAQDMGKAIERREGKRNNNALGIKRSINESGPKTSCPKCNKTLNGSNQSKCVDTECPLKAEMAPADNEWAGWKTALKPAHEPIVMARKPFRGSCVDNVLNHGVGALNIDATRVPWGEEDDPEAYIEWMKKYPNSTGSKQVFNNAHAGAKGIDYVKDKDAEVNKARDVDNRMAGRFPSNVLGEVEDYQKFFYCPKVNRAERHIGFESPPDPIANYSTSEVKNHPLWDPSIGTNLQRLKHKILEHNKDLKPNLDHIPTNSDGMLAAHYEKDAKGNPIYNNQKGIYTMGDALEELGGHWEKQKTNYKGSGSVAVSKEGNIIPQSTLQTMVESKAMGNNHPTVKPVALMKYLIKLVTPAGGSVLDPFCGSGSTGMAAVELGYDFTGCELDPDYVDIATKRITAWGNKTDLNNNPLPTEWFTEQE